MTYVSARTTSTFNINVGSTRLNGSSDIIKDEFTNGNTVGWATSISIISLVDDDTVVGNAGKGDA